MDETRIGDEEREHATSVLARHVADGRLTLGEYEQRLDAVYAARVPSELVPALRDLPALGAPAAPRTRGRRPAVSTAVLGWIVLSAALVAVWAVAGFGFPWPIFPIMATASKVFGSPDRVEHRRGWGWGCAARRDNREVVASGP